MREVPRNYSHKTDGTIGEGQPRRFKSQKLGVREYRKLKRIKAGTPWRYCRFGSRPLQ